MPATLHGNAEPGRKLRCPLIGSAIRRSSIGIQTLTPTTGSQTVRCPCAVWTYAEWVRSSKALTSAKLASATWRSTPPRTRDAIAPRHRVGRSRGCPAASRDRGRFRARLAGRTRRPAQRRRSVTTKRVLRTLAFAAWAAMTAWPAASGAAAPDTSLERQVSAIEWQGRSRPREAVQALDRLLPTTASFSPEQLEVLTASALLLNRFDPEAAESAAHLAAFYLVLDQADRARTISRPCGSRPPIRTPG